MPKIVEVKAPKPGMCHVKGCNRKVRSSGFCAADFQKYHLLKRTNRLPPEWSEVHAGTRDSVIENVVLPRGRAGAKALAEAKRKRRERTDAADQKVLRARNSSTPPYTRKMVEAQKQALKTAKSIESLMKTETKRVPYTNKLVTSATAPMSEMRRFVLDRAFDPTGTSGVGIVAEGVQFSNGGVVIHWLSQLEAVNVYANATVLERLHGHGGNTSIVWLDT